MYKWDAIPLKEFKLIMKKIKHAPKAKSITSHVIIENQTRSAAIFYKKAQYHIKLINLIRKAFKNKTKIEISSTRSTKNLSLITKPVFNFVAIPKNSKTPSTAAIEIIYDFIKYHAETNNYNTESISYKVSSKHEWLLGWEIPHSIEQEEYISAWKKFSGFSNNTKSPIRIKLTNSTHKSML
jgi:hypothetical protein